MMETLRLQKFRPFVVGVDAGATTGLAVYRRSTSKIIATKSTDFCGAIRYLTATFPNKCEATIFVELPGMFMYARNDDQQEKVRDNMLIKIGGNRREAELLARMLREAGFDDVREVAPVRKKNKWTQAQFTMYTGSYKQTNEHVRDAARLALFNANKR